MRKNKEIKNEISKVVQGMMNEDAKEVKIAQTIGQNGAVNVGTPENDLVYYTNVIDPDDPNPYNPTMIIKAVTISLSAAQRYSQACLNQIINMYPAFNDYLGDHNGKKSLNVYVVLDKNVETMATDQRNIYINPLFLWKLAHKNNFGWASWTEEYDKLEPKDRRGLWPICDQGNVFVIMHEVYHCLYMHRLREEKFRMAHPEIIDFDHNKANIVQDQEINSALEAYCYFDALPDLNGKQSGVVKNIQGILFDKDGQGTNKVSSKMYDKLYQGPFEFNEGAGVYAGDTAEDVYGYKIKRKYPTNFGQTWEDMYLYFQDHGWPELPSRQNPPQMGSGGFPGSSSNNNNDNPEDQEIYDAGYYDGYYSKPIDRGLRNESDYQMGYNDGQENRAIDDQNNTCINSPEYIQGREDAENGLVNESKIYLDRNRKSSSVLMNTYYLMKQCGYLCEWVNIDKDSDYYKQGVASVLSKKRQSSNNGRGQNNSSSQEQGQENHRRTQQDSNGNGQGREGQNDSGSQGNQGNQGNSQGNKKSGKKRGGQSSGERGGQDEQNGNQGCQGGQGGQENQGNQNGQGKNGKSSSNKRPHRHQPLGPDGKPIQKGGQGGQGGQGSQGPIDWNDLSDEEKKNIRDAIEGGDTSKQSGGTPINNLPPDLQYGGDDTGAQFGDGGDQLTAEEGENILRKIKGGQLDPLMDNPDEKWRDANLNQKAGKLPTDDDLSKLPQEVIDQVRRKSGNGWQEGHLATKQKIMDAMKSDVNWQDQLMGYIRGAFKAPRDKINKKDVGLDRDFTRKIEVPNGGESIGNIAFALDQSGSMWCQTGAKDNGGNAIPSSMRKFFKEIADIREKIGKPIKGIATWAFASNEPVFYADYHKEGFVPHNWNPIDKSGGTDFDHVFKLMKEGKVYDKKGDHFRLWTGYNDSSNFPIVTVICTDGEDDVPKKANVWDTDERLIIWFVINQSPTYIQTFRQKLKNAGYSTQYYIGITTDQI